VSQATWAVVRAAVPLLKQLAGGKLQVTSCMAAPELCCALACLCGRSSPCGRAFATHIFKECALYTVPFGCRAYAAQRRESSTLLDMPLLTASGTVNRVPWAMPPTDRQSLCCRRCALGQTPEVRGHEDGRGAGPAAESAPALRIAGALESALPAHPPIVLAQDQQRVCAAGRHRAPPVAPR
jgi:hypothetical protein